jgi:uncharacterized protein involved in exopolysaccharide biosynthesis
MLERRSTSIQEQRPVAETGQPLTPAYLYDVLKRRPFYFAIPFLLILAIGSAITALLPAQYLSQGTILVASQEIPTDLVRPTVAALANDRIQVIEQRIMTRDNLLAIAKKFPLTPGWQERLSGTEVVDFIRKRTEIKPAELKLKGRKKYDIAFNVGFLYEQPAIATKVANELVTMILNEDVRSRTEYASETTRFLAKEVKRLEDQLHINDAKIAEIQKSRLDALADTSPLGDEKDLAALKAKLLVLGATRSSTHPDVIALKRSIKALEKSAAAANVNAGTASDGTNNKPLGLDALQTQRESLKVQLAVATQKLSAARLGESLERGQHSERLEVIEQPTLPGKPVSPNRPKIFAVVFVMAIMAGAGLVIGAEKLDQSIYRRADLASLIDSHLIVSIPYISTIAETRHKKIRNMTIVASVLIAILAGVTVIYFVLPDADIFLYKLMPKMFG